MTKPDRLDFAFLSVVVALMGNHHPSIACAVNVLAKFRGKVLTPTDAQDMSHCLRPLLLVAFGPHARLVDGPKI